MTERVDIQIVGPRQHGLSYNTVALINTNCDEMSPLSTKWPETPRIVVCVNMQIVRAAGAGRHLCATKGI